MALAASAYRLREAGARACRPRLSSFRGRVGLSILGAMVVTGGLGIELSGKREQFSTALHSAPIATLVLVVALQVLALLARSEAWYVCICAAGATAARRLMFRAAGIGYLASVINGSLGVAARVTCLRRLAGDSVPRIPALLAAEIPIITVEIALAAAFSFTLIAAVGAPWWLPLAAVVVMTFVALALHRVSERRRVGLWSGLAVMRHGRYRMIAFVLLAVCAQIARNWLVLHALGLHVSLLSSIALLIAMFTLGQLPIGPSVGAAAAVLILGSHGVAATAAAGVLLTATGITGSLVYAAWAIGDRLLSGARAPRSVTVASSAQAPDRSALPEPGLA